MIFAPVLTGIQMSLQDQYTIDKMGVPAAWLMECAATAVRLNLQKSLDAKDRIAVICGSGNNAGDGYAVARQLYIQGYEVACFQCGEVRSEEAKLNFEIMHKAGLKSQSIVHFVPDEFDWAVDALVGTGLRQALREELKAAVEAINKVRNIISVDIPSGICSVSGYGWGCFVRATKTVTFQFAKRGHYLSDGIAASGDLVIVDIGISPFLRDKACWYRRLLAEPQAPLYLTDRTSHKGIQGRVLVAGSALGTLGAGLFCARAAQNAGSGLVSIMAPDQSRPILQSQCPEIMVKAFDAETQADVLVLGPGCSQDQTIQNQLKKLLRSFTNSVIIDAEGLRMFKDWTELIALIGTNRPNTEILLTPHPGEMRALFELYQGQLSGNLADMITTLNNYGVSILAKDAYSVLYTPAREPIVLGEPNANLARGGSGDILAGLIASFMARGHRVIEACCLAVDWLYSAASSDRLKQAHEHLTDCGPNLLLLKSIDAIRLECINGRSS